MAVQRHAPLRRRDFDSRGFGGGPRGPDGARKPVMTFRVTHVGATGHRHRIEVQAASNAMAMAWVEQLYGEARKLSVILIRRPAP